MKKKFDLKRFLSILLLGPLLPILGVEGGNVGDGSNNNADGNDTNTEGQENNTQNTDNRNDNNQPNNNSRMFTQDEVNAIISSRLERDRKNTRDSVIKELEEKQARENMSEVEKLKADLEAERNKTLEIQKQNNISRIKSEVQIKALALNIVDADAAYTLLNKENIDIDENGKVLNVDEALNSLVKDKPWLVKQSNQQSNTNIGDNQNTGNQNNQKGPSMNDLIRSHTGRK